MRKCGLLAGIVLVLITVVLSAVSADADVTKVRTPDLENNTKNLVEKPSVVTVQPPVDAQAAAPNKTVAATEIQTDKNVPVSPANTADPNHANKEAAVTSPPPVEEKQAAAPKPQFNDDYASNKTALKAIEKSVEIFKDRIKDRFSVYLERSARYVDIMQEILKEKHLPEDLVFLPIVESGFNPNAYSRAKAVGPWQFIASTGKRYGLVIDWWRDERKDPVKSTVAAADYLKDLYKMFGSWNLALAAYNAGEGKISKALRKSDSDNYWSLLSTKQIRNETKEYVPSYIAATMIANSPEEYGFHNLDYREPLEYDEVTVSFPLDIDVIAKCAECTVKEIREMNPELRRWSTPPNIKNYTIRIPDGSKEIFLKNLASIPKDERFTVEQYTMKKGDTIKKVAKKTGMPVSTILAMNSLSNLGQLKSGDTISLPPKGKYCPDPDDKASFVQKVAYKNKSSRKHSGKKAGRSSSKKSHPRKSRSKVRTKKA
ncbi:MAG: transglycosylase SLT domain-containing protein [Nitrospirae bacterium]|nr:transglycosylase SLT domain-containing protein [Nitrospirota bacterium]